MAGAGHRHLAGAGVEQAVEHGDEKLALHPERERVVGAMQTRPFLVGGSDRFDSILIEETDGRVVAKIGAEGVHSAALLDQGVGVAVKVEDGAQRAQFPALVRLLQLLDALPADLPARLDEFLRRQIRNTRGETVGEVRPVS